MLVCRERKQGGENMSAAERRQGILTELYSSRFATCENLARRFDVTTRTIYHDIEKLVCSHPVKVVRGRYGGVKLEDWFDPNSRFLAPEQFTLPVRMKDRVTSDELIILNSILDQFAP